MSQPRQATIDIDAIMRRAPVIPVIVIDELDKAVPLARALVKGGLEVLEITLRTSVAMRAIKAILDDVEGAVVGAGTVLNGTQLEAVGNLGCAFAVSPGATDGLLDAARDAPCPLLPGASTASEVMRLLDRGYVRQKFFPAEQAGGVPFLKSIGSPLPEALFCPTGGIGVANAKSYLALDNVLCVGGSWVAPPALVRDGAWNRITDLALAARSLPAEEKA
ncbi:MAG: bifunctional 4-hydroxy-2-oxoglutarate aldolase/2-dehydro-3-deoxy-phosphogluconate aldolase [Geminicoccaceae bacterium]